MDNMLLIFFMARPLRIEFASRLYRITSRGDRREPIYEGDHDRGTFLKMSGVDEQFNLALSR